MDLVLERGLLIILGLEKEHLTTLVWGKGLHITLALEKEIYGRMVGEKGCHIILELEDKENFICALFSFLVCILGGVLEFIWPAESKTSPTCLIE